MPSLPRRNSTRAVIVSALALGSAGLAAASGSAQASGAPNCISATGSSNGPIDNGDGTLSQVFVGTTSNVTLPSYVTQVHIDLCGAAGTGWNAGWGGRTTADLAIPSGQTLSVVAGTRNGSIGHGGAGFNPGGGYSSVSLNGTLEAIAGGGGGGGANGGAGGHGGHIAGAGAYGSGAKTYDTAAAGGGGATTTAAGGGGGGGYSGGSAGTGGTSLAGGSGGASYNDYYGYHATGGGGGGGGYYGGGGGGAGGEDWGYYGTGAGGGGGSSWADASTSNASYSDSARGSDGAVVITYTAKQDQTISFAPPAGKTFGDAPFDVSATSTSGLPVTFSVGNGDQCTLAGATVTLTGAGSCTVTAHQAGNDAYNAARDVSQTLAIAPQPVPVTVTASETYGGATAFTSTVATLPHGVTLSGSATCTTVDRGDMIDAHLSAGEHTIDAKSCAGLSLTDPVNYVISYVGGTLTYDPNTSIQSVSETVTGATLGFVSAPGAATPPATTLNGVDEVTPDFTLPLDIGDATGSGAGWNVSMSATPFTDATGRTLGALYQTREATPRCDAHTTCTLATDATSLIDLLDPVTYGAAKLLQVADAGTGMGDQTMSPSFKLAVPANTYAGNYSSTWTVSLNSAPQ